MTADHAAETMNPLLGLAICLVAVLAFPIIFLLKLWAALYFAVPASFFMLGVVIYLTMDKKVG
jgi:hypothetical protein